MNEKRESILNHISAIRQEFNELPGVCLRDKVKVGEMLNTIEQIVRAVTVLAGWRPGPTEHK